MLAALDEPFRLEPLQHLAGRRARDAEHLGDARRDRRGGVRVGPVLADREGEEVDRLEVLVDRMSLPVRHRPESSRGAAGPTRLAARPPPRVARSTSSVRPRRRTSARARRGRRAASSVAAGSRSRSSSAIAVHRRPARRRAGRPPPRASSRSATRSGSGRARALRAPAGRRPAGRRSAARLAARRDADDDDERDDERRCRRPRARGAAAPTAPRGRATSARDDGDRGAAVARRAILGGGDATSSARRASERSRMREPQTSETRGSSVATPRFRVALAPRAAAARRGRCRSPAKMRRASSASATAPRPSMAATRPEPFSE